jgi:hypothetical protein
MAMTPETVALSVINDGGTYTARMAVAIAWFTGPHGLTTAPPELVKMVRAECRKPHWSGARMTTNDDYIAAEQVLDYTLSHLAEINREDQA